MILILFAIIGFGIIAKAQDVITLKNGTDINALVQEIGDVDVKYKKFDNPNGPNYTLKKSEILIIRYANGDKDIFSEEEKPVEKKDASTSESDSLKNNGNSSINTNFTLKKSDKIMIDTYVSSGQDKKRCEKVCDLLEQKMRKLGFCCVYKMINENDTTTTNIVIAVYPKEAFYTFFRFHIFDKTLNRNVFDETYIYWTTLNKVVDNFVNDIIPFIEK